MKTSMEFSITKARCQFETYDEREQASTRFVFAIHEFEIRDRLLTKSEFNKFLYLYTTEAVPRRTHADMVCQLISFSFEINEDERLSFLDFSWFSKFFTRNQKAI